MGLVMGKKFVTYEQAVQTFLDRGFCLDTDQETFDKMSLTDTKLDCYCVKHPDFRASYYYTVVKSGRCGCSQCRKERGRSDWTNEEKLQFIKDCGYEYISGDLTRILNPLHLKCRQGHNCCGTINALKHRLEICYECKDKLPANYWDLDKCQGWMANDEIFSQYKILDFVIEDGEKRVFLKCPNPLHPAYWTSWGHVYREHTVCRECYYDNESKVNWTLDRAIKFLAQYGFTMVNQNEYVSSHRRIACYDELGFIYMVSVHYLARNRTSFHLLKGNPYAVHNINRFCELYRPDYEFVTQQYYGSYSEHTWRYNGDCLDDKKFDREFKMSVHAFMRAMCNHPMLSTSKLEAKCVYILNKYKIKHRRQKTFDGCVDKHKLRFDFYLQLNGERICIEVDGSQHKYPVSKWDGMQGLIDRQRRDEIKNRYCKNNNIRLIRIPHTQFTHMEDILIEELGLTKIE